MPLFFKMLGHKINSISIAVFIFQINLSDRFIFRASALLVYNLAQYRMRDKFKSVGETLPNQLNKEVQNPTLRWIFQFMKGLEIGRPQVGSGNSVGRSVRELVTKMTPFRKKIIRLFVPTAC